MSSIIFFYTENRPKGKKQKRNVQKNDSHDEHSDHIVDSINEGIFFLNLTLIFFLIYLIFLFTYIDFDKH